jgi:phosphonatase-like hydrolase
MKPELVAFDVAGTTLNDDGVVIHAFQIAFEATQPDLWPKKGQEWTQYALDTMGQSKIHVFTELLGDAELAHRANVAFEEAYVTHIAEVGVAAIAGTNETFAFLKNEGIKIALTTGFSRSTLDFLIDHVGWRGVVDITVTPEEAGRGRPHPDMLNFAVAQMGIGDTREIIVIGDTASDIQAGLAFGANQVIGVLSGAHTREVLEFAGATSVINSVADLPSLI